MGQVRQPQQRFLELVSFLLMQRVQALDLFGQLTRGIQQLKRIPAIPFQGTDLLAETIPFGFETFHFDGQGPQGFVQLEDVVNLARVDALVRHTGFYMVRLLPDGLQRNHDSPGALFLLLVTGRLARLS